MFGLHLGLSVHELKKLECDYFILLLILSLKFTCVLSDSMINIDQTQIIVIYFWKFKPKSTHFFSFFKLSEIAKVLIVSSAASTCKHLSKP